MIKGFYKTPKGVMEYGSPGVLEKMTMQFFQYSNTPSLQYSGKNRLNKLDFAANLGIST
jgi:hypothetical protein